MLGRSYMREASCTAAVQMTKSEESLMSMEHYVQKTFFKTASLMANSCQCIAILGGADERVTQAAYTYGRNLGLAFQVRETPFPAVLRVSGVSHSSSWLDF